MISIIIPIFNSHQFIRHCLDSVLRQSFIDWECILVNDGSYDDSGAICDEYVAMDARFQVIHNKDRVGVSKARNIGLEKVKGDFFTFLDSDDIMGDDALEKLMMHSQSSDCVFFGYNIISNDGAEVINRVAFEPAVVKGTEAIIHYFFSYIDNNKMPFFCYGKLYKTSIIRQNNISFDEQMSLGEDRVFVLNYLEHCESLYSDNYRGINVRKSASGNSLSSKKRSPAEAFLNFRRNYDYLISLCSKYNLLLIKQYADNFLITRCVDYILRPHTQNISDSRKIYFYVKNSIIPFVIQNDIHMNNVIQRRYKIYCITLNKSAFVSIILSYAACKLRNMLQ